MGIPLFTKGCRPTGLRLPVQCQTAVVICRDFDIRVAIQSRLEVGEAAQWKNKRDPLLSELGICDADSLFVVATDFIHDFGRGLAREYEAMLRPSLRTGERPAAARQKRSGRRHFALLTGIDVE